MNNVDARATGDGDGRRRGQHDDEDKRGRVEEGHGSEPDVAVETDRVSPASLPRSTCHSSEQKASINKDGIEAPEVGGTGARRRRRLGCPQR